MGGTSTDVAVCVVGPSRDHPRDAASATSPCAPPPSTSRASAPAAARSPTSPRRPGRCGSARESAGAAAGPGLLRARRDRADGDRRERRPRPSAAAPARRRDELDADAATPRSHAWPRRAAPDVDGDRSRRSSTWSTRRCSARCASSRCSAAARRASSRSSPSAAPAACTRTRSRGSSAPIPVIVPAESGVLSALGFIASEIKNEFSQTFIRSIAATHAGRGPQAVRRARRHARATGSTRRASRSPTRTSGSSSTCATPAGLRDPDRAGAASSSPRSSSPRWSGRFGEEHQPPLRVRARRRRGDRQPAGSSRPDASRSRSSRRARWAPTDRIGGADAARSRCGRPGGPLDVPTYERAALEPGMAIERLRDRRAVRRDHGRAARATSPPSTPG